MVMVVVMALGSKSQSLIPQVSVSDAEEIAGEIHDISGKSQSLIHQVSVSDLNY